MRCVGYRYQGHPALIFFFELLDERVIHLQEIHQEAFETRDLGVSGTEIIYGEFEAQ